MKREQVSDIAASLPAPHYEGHRERLRERFREAGAAALSDYELLELLLFAGIPRRDVKPLAKELLAKFGSFADVVAVRPAVVRILTRATTHGFTNDNTSVVAGRFYAAGQHSYRGVAISRRVAGR